jgi:hypothetical protein
MTKFTGVPVCAYACWCAHEHLYVHMCVHTHSKLSKLAPAVMLLTAQDTFLLLPFEYDAGWAPELIWLFQRRKKPILSP